MDGTRGALLLLTISRRVYSDVCLTSGKSSLVPLVFRPILVSRVDSFNTQSSASTKERPEESLTALKVTTFGSFGLSREADRRRSTLCINFLFSNLSHSLTHSVSRLRQTLPSVPIRYQSRKGRVHRFHCCFVRTVVLTKSGVAGSTPGAQHEFDDWLVNGVFTALGWSLGEILHERVNECLVAG